MLTWLNMLIAEKQVICKNIPLTLPCWFTHKQQNVATHFLPTARWRCTVDKKDVAVFFCSHRD